MLTIEKTKPKPILTPIIIFSLIMFFACLSEAIMSYASPVYVQSYLKNTFIMGLIFSSSAFIGMFFDIYIANRFWHKNYNFFIKIMLTGSLMFPLIYLFGPPTIPVFLLGMIVWSAYYEFKGFSSYNFIHHFLTKEEHTHGWAILTAFTSLAYVLGPAIAADITGVDIRIAFVAALVPLCVSIGIYSFFINNKRQPREADMRQVKENQKGVIVQFRVLAKLWSKVWPLFIFVCVIALIDSCFWTVGILFSEKLKAIDRVGALLLVAYMLPPVFIGPIVTNIHHKLGKKRSAFISALAGSVFLVMLSFVKSVSAAVLVVFIFSILESMAYVLYEAVIEDYIARLQDFGNDMVTISQVTTGIGYVLGPVLFGAIAMYLSYQQTFGIAGVLLGAVSCICLYIVPRKIKMPQTELKELTS